MKLLIIIILLLLIVTCIFIKYKQVNENFTQKRKAYLLTCNETSDRAQFSKNILENVGFDVIFFQCIKNEDKVLSNTISMQSIWEIIANGQDEWSYVFEDDINILEDIKIDEIIEYEKISKMFFYLGACGFINTNELYQPNLINGHKVAIINGKVRGLHAIGLSKEGAKELLKFSKNNPDITVSDIIVEMFSEIYNANLVRYDLESSIPDHRGIFFQDRTKFSSLLNDDNYNNM